MNFEVTQELYPGSVNYSIVVSLVRLVNDLPWVQR